MAILIGGLIMIVCGAGGFVLFGLSASLSALRDQHLAANNALISSISLVVAFAGLVIIVIGVIKGFRAGRGIMPGRERTVPECRIVTRFARNGAGQMIFQDFEFAAPGSKLYVQISFPDGHVEELVAPWPVFEQCGEGMRGAAILNGNWLSSFAAILETGHMNREHWRED